ncbi:hypothetical protein JAAARDRAFT_429177 [Jaapia argillacea MUCL 33604]|uniref:Uncharacterized protein n=1 Tax=Jaapia argillacea MUCL 33604 TaxID=933084 RepID=A0A067PFM5_9AGAM|nr:hypothetical protein JAAARDRAFT_429177 [Jaapia argillacea MUCL 33604]
MKVQVQKEAKEEMERLRTQFIFKQHEVETSVRKPPWGKKLPNREGIPPTPLRMPSQSVARTQPNAMAGPSTVIPSVKQTPSRSRIVTFPRETPKANRKGKAPVPPGSDKKPSKLPGFYNSFQPSSPERPTRTRSTRTRNVEIEPPSSAGKGKTRERSSLLDYASQGAGRIQHIPSPPSSPTRNGTNHLNNNDVDIQMDDVYDNGVDFPDAQATPFADALEDEIIEELDVIEPIDWNAELYRIVFSHTYTSSGSHTFQLLLASQLPDDLPNEIVHSYSLACISLLQIFGSSFSPDDWPALASKVASCLVKMAFVFNAASSVSTLTALFSLLAALCLSLPSFSGALLACDEDPSIVGTICDIIRNHLRPSKDLQEESREGLAALARTTVELLEALSWNIPDEVEDRTRLASIPWGANILETLLDSQHPVWFLRLSIQFMVLLASRSGLFRALLSPPDTGEGPLVQPLGTKEFKPPQVPYIECLCTFLVNPSRQGPEAEMMRRDILIFFATLSTAHIDAPPILLESQALVPALVVYLTNVTTALWEDDDELKKSSELTASYAPLSDSPFILILTSSPSCVRMVNQTLFLLHYLVNDSDNILKTKLHQASQRQFNGVLHMFVVTFGRLCYSRPPAWVDEELKLELEGLVGPALDLLESVIEGPEMDAIWCANNDDEGDDMNDEEKEAWMLEANEIE